MAGGGDLFSGGSDSRPPGPGCANACRRRSGDGGIAPRAWRVRRFRQAGKWEIACSPRREAAGRGNGWINPGNGSLACLPELSGFILQARGDAGILSVRKRAYNKGYLTSCLVPGDLFVAHQVMGLSGIRKQGIPLSGLQDRYGKPDGIPEGEGGVRHYRYRVVAKQNAIPVSAHAVGFEVKGAKRFAAKYTVHTNGFESVQEKLDALQRQRERDYVAD